MRWSAEFKHAKETLKTNRKQHNYN